MPKGSHVCPTCNGQKADFYALRCRKCWFAERKENARGPNPRRNHAKQLRRFYGLSLADYDAMLDAQDGLCAVCRETCVSGRNLAVDHDHGTGLIRGLLCANCNRGIGLFKDKPLRLRQAAEYLGG